MRITTGIFKGKKLISPRLKNIRLTEEKVRKAIFDVLGDFVKEANVLELFAGSGALGLEAISRGANRVVFVDKEKECIETIKKNTPEEAKKKVEVIWANCFKAIDYLIKRKEKFDLVILDPPYKEGMVVLSLKKLAKSSILLKSQAIIVVEHHKDEEWEEDDFFILKQKKYRKILVSFLKLKNGKNCDISRNF